MRPFGSRNCLCAGSALSAANTQLALPPAAAGRTAVERRAARRDASPHRTAVERRSYQADFAKCGGGRRVVEAPPRWRLSQLTRPARRAGPTTGGPRSRAAADGTAAMPWGAAVGTAFHRRPNLRRGPPGAARRDASPHREMAVTRDACPYRNGQDARCPSVSTGEMSVVPVIQWARRP